MQNELSHLFTQYSYNNIISVSYENGCTFENTVLKQMLPYLHQYEHPDIIGIQNDKLLVMEHFMFDGTKEKKHKGMNGLREENRIHTKLKEFYGSETKCGSVLQPITYVQTSADYIKNLQKHFNAHYKKIPQYIQTVVENEHRTFSQISVGFFIENEYPPYYLCLEKQQIRLIHLCYTKQFLDIFEQSSDLDFVLFGFCDETYKLHYIDKHSLPAHRADEVDLTQISFYKPNEVQFACKYTDID